MSIVKSVGLMCLGAIAFTAIKSAMGGYDKPEAAPEEEPKKEEEEAKEPVQEPAEEPKTEEVKAAQAAPSRGLEVFEKEKATIIATLSDTDSATFNAAVSALDDYLSGLDPSDAQTAAEVSRVMVLAMAARNASLGKSDLIPGYMGAMVVAKCVADLAAAVRSSRATPAKVEAAVFAANVFTEILLKTSRTADFT